MTNTAILGSYGDNSGSGLMFRNKIINGDMRIDQRNAGAAINNLAAQYTFTLDRFKFYGTLANIVEIDQVQDAPAGFTHSLQLKSLAATTPATLDEYALYHLIEGFNITDLNWGTANAKPITLSFWIKSSVTGTFGGSISDNTVVALYVFQYTINTANTWEYKTITITPPTNAGSPFGTWNLTNQLGIRICFDLGSGDSRTIATPNSWVQGSALNPVGIRFRSTGNVRLVNTNNALLNMTGLQLEVGSAATTFENRPIGIEKLLCFRYYQEHTFEQGGPIGFVDTATVSVHTWQFPVEMRSSLSSFSYSGTLEVRRGGIVASIVTALVATNDGGSSTRLIATSNSLTVGQCVQLVTANNGVLVKFKFASEL